MRAPRRLEPVHLLPLSLFGLVLVALLAGLPQTVRDDMAWRKPVVGGAFSIVLLSGIFAGLFPATCMGRHHFKRRERKPVQKVNESAHEAIRFRGHHPNCANFAAHVFRTGDLLFCAGCGGLMLGAALSLIGVAGYFFLNLSFEPWDALVFWIGFGGVASGLLQYHLFNWGGSPVHLLVNVFFVVGVSMLLVGIDELVQSATASVYVIILSVFWLYTRILLSQSHHRKICTYCGKENCGYA